MSRSAICKAKNPATCPYHGAVIRMHQAAVTGDVQAYFDARTEVQNLENSNLSEDELVSAINEDSLPAGSAFVAPTPEEPLTPYQKMVKDGKFPTAPFVSDMVGKTPPYLRSDDGDILYARADMDQPFHGEFDYIRVVLDRPLEHAGGGLPAEHEHLAQLIGYKYRSTIVGESLANPERDTDQSMVIFADVTKSQSSNMFRAIGKFEDEFGDFLNDGSPVRQRGENAGTRLVTGLRRPARAALYYGYAWRQDEPEFAFRGDAEGAVAESSNWNERDEFEELN